MGVQIFYLQLAILTYGFASGISSGTKTDQATTQTEYTEEDHYDKAHPIALNYTHQTFTSISLVWAMPGGMENYTGQLSNFVLYYHKRIHKGSIHEYINVTVPANQTSFTIEDLDLGTNYSFYVEANYTTGQRPASHTFTFPTSGYGPDRPCTCHLIGSVNNTCDPRSGQCICRSEGYNDKRCESCKPNYYWHTTLGCHICPPCNPDHSNGTCYVDRESHLVLCRCTSPWAGDKCEHCGTGFYKDAKAPKCRPCRCNDNSEKKTNLCHYQTGVCQDCKFNTTGDNCEKCLPGYEGDAVIGRNCTLLSAVANVPARKGGVIVGVCVALFIIIIIVVSVGICQRMRGRKPKFNFWTVELKDDHEQKRHGRSYIYVPNGDRAELIEGELFSDDGTE